MRERGRNKKGQRWRKRRKEAEKEMNRGEEKE